MLSVKTKTLNNLKYPSQYCQIGTMEAPQVLTMNRMTMRMTTMIAPMTETVTAKTVKSRRMLAMKDLAIQIWATTRIRVTCQPICLK